MKDMKHPTTYKQANCTIFYHILAGDKYFVTYLLTKKMLLTCSRMYNFEELS